jgi:hypothetical protein
MYYDESNGVTTMAFTRLLDTGNSNNFALTRNAFSSAYVVYGCHPFDGISPRFFSLLWIWQQQRNETAFSMVKE